MFEVRTFFRDGYAVAGRGLMISVGLYLYDMFLGCPH